VISDVVIAEIDKAPPKYAKDMLRHIDRVDPVKYLVDSAMEELARAYVAAGVLPESRRADAVHIAAATCLDLDYLVSWNHRHMTRPKKRLQYASVNQLHDYLKTPLICNPFEACDELQP
jgi:hypothetical protein